MFCGKQANNLYNESLIGRFELGSSYYDLILQGNTDSIHGRNLKLMLVEVFKSFYDLGPPILQDILGRRASKLTFH